MQIPRNDGKVILEHFGLVASNSDECSIAMMVAPVDWSEPAQLLDCNEYVVVLEGVLEILHPDQKPTKIGRGEGYMAPKNHAATYRNGGDIECKYISICIPAFSPDRWRLAKK